MVPLQDSFWTEKNACTYVDGNDGWLYCDGEAYFKAFIEACERATSTIFILGWDTHTRTNLDPKREGSAQGDHWNLATFFRRILKNHPKLHIYLLSWRPAPLYIMEREKLQNFKFTRFCHPRLHFCTDSHHPIGGSHHEKIVIIDDQLAFVGGMDLTIRRWDTCMHAAEDPLRKDPDGQYYQPYHDAQLGMAGPAAWQLAQMFRQRWKQANGTNIPMVPPTRVKPPAPAQAIAFFEDAPIAVSLTYPSFRNSNEVKQIAQVYEDLLLSAQRYVYIETQYLTSHHMVDILCRLGQRSEGPEITLVLPERLGPWLEKRTMSHLQYEALTKVLAYDFHKRVHIVYPYDQELIPIYKYVTVHSKLMIVDDQFLTLGSANLNNRSMGLDTECNVTIDARQQPHLQRSIRKALAFLIVHYANHDASYALQELERTGSPLQVLKSLRLLSPDKHLADFKLQPMPEEKIGWLDADLLDMDQPSALEIAMDRWGRMLEIIQRHLKVPPRMMALVMTGLAGASIAASYAWMFSPLYGNQWTLNFYPQNGMPHDTRLSTLLLIPILYVIACLLLAPINLLILLTASFFPALPAFSYIVLSVIGLVSLGYVAGRCMGRFFFPQFYGRHTPEGFAALCLLRIMPIAPNTLVNVAAGAARIPYLRFMGATLAGMAPGCIMLVIFQRCIINAFLNPGWTTVLPLIVLVLLASAVFRWSSQRFSNYGS
ncbi:MAG TPA: phospholipase D-like domain-containing protein [Oligoflexus sp.]|uniref:phospholipase D-like domain-containing protein n=1 Tax=Oligoflexus sp. TaxID=1971216 RepID=UPI002D72B24A|nr:phospholipase D-like domain-containing protein [Oligoflexus sp.]HYX35764.1 phospholipase D-like domain-containing protein [Oligoflexus sp.]